MAAETRTRALWRERTLKFEEMGAALRKTAAVEFPPGTMVRWVHSYDRMRRPITREGVVTSLCGYGLNVQMKPGGPIHRVEAYLAEIVTGDVQP